MWPSIRIERGVVFRREDVLGFDRYRLGLGRRADHSKDRVRQDWATRRGGRESHDIQDRSRSDPLRLLGLDPRAAAAVVDIDHVAHESEPRGAREIADLDRVAGNVSGHHAADPHPAVELARGRVVVDALDRSGGHRERIGRGLQDFDVARAADKERHAAQLFGGTEKRPDIAAQPDTGVDEALQVCRRMVPEGDAQHTFLERDVGEERPHLRIRRLPCPQDDTVDLNEIAVVPTGQHRRKRDALRDGQFALAQAPDGGGHDVRRETTADGLPLELDEIALPQIPPGWHRCVRGGR